MDTRDATKQQPTPPSQLLQGPSPMAVDDQRPEESSQRSASSRPSLPESDHLPFPMLTDDIATYEYAEHWLAGHPGYPVIGPVAEGPEVPARRSLSSPNSSNSDKRARRRRIMLRSTPIFLFPLNCHLHANNTSTTSSASTSPACPSSSSTSPQSPHHRSLQTSFTTTHGGSTSRAAARRDGTRP